MALAPPAGAPRLRSAASGFAVPRRLAVALASPAAAPWPRSGASSVQAPRRRIGCPSKAARVCPRRRMELRPHSIRGRRRPRACRVATSSFDRAATNLAVGTPQADRKSPRWRRAAPRGRPDTTPARRPHLPTQPGRRTPQNANSNTRPISFDRSFGPPNLAQKQRRCGGTMSVQGARSSGTWNRA
jgi:hypothetical protein